MDEPAPCPFCGELGVNFVTAETTKWGAAQCGSCGALGPDVRTSYDTGPTAAWHAEAIEEWNRRPEPEVLPCYLCAVPGKDERCSTPICDDCGRKAVAERNQVRTDAEVMAAGITIALHTKQLDYRSPAADALLDYCDNDMMTIEEAHRVFETRRPR